MIINGKELPVEEEAKFSLKHSMSIEEYINKIVDEKIKEQFAMSGRLAKMAEDLDTAMKINVKQTDALERLTRLVIKSDALEGLTRLVIKSDADIDIKRIT